MQWKNLGALCGFAGMVGTLAACSSAKGPAPMPPTIQSMEKKSVDSVEKVDTVTAQATVVAVDQASRLVTLRRSDGERFEIRADEKVRNLAQVRKGDLVTVVYQRALAVTVRKPGEAQPGVAGGKAMERAPLGEKPAGAAGRTVRVIAKVTKVDRAKQTITLRGEKGKTVTIDVKDPENLEKVKKGDLLDIDYTEALAVSVDKPE